MSEGSWLLSITAGVPAAEEDAFNEWYDERHIPAVLRVPGVHSARRYVSEGPDGKRYLAQYEVDGPQVMQSPEFQAASQATPYDGQAKFDVSFYRKLGA